MINITNHAYKKYAQRIKNIDNDNIIQQVNTNKTQWQLELEKMFNHSELIYTGKFNEKHNNTNFRLVDNIILVTNIQDNTIITLYRVDFGFGRDVDVQILESLLNKLSQAKAEYANTMELIKEEKDNLEISKHNLKEEISSIEKTLIVMKDSLKSLDDYIDKFSYKEYQSKANLDTTAKKIVYSIEYRKESMEYTR